MSYFDSQIAKHNAVKVYLKDIAAWPKEKAVWFETKNFGWMLSAPDKDGKRQLLIKY